MPQLTVPPFAKPAQVARSLPLHVALLQLPSPLPSVGHAARVEGGAPVTGTQWPATLHAWHESLGLHAESQHTPSTQLPEPQLLAAVHLKPRSPMQVPVPI